MFIMAGMLIVALSGVYVMLLGVKAAGIQSQSTKAYYTAETGAEELLWQMRTGARPSPTTPSPTMVILSGSVGTGNYSVYYLGFPPLIFQSVGDYQNTRRSVEIRM
jgi:hypothetical protein